MMASPEDSTIAASVPHLNLGPPALEEFSLLHG